MLTFHILPSNYFRVEFVHNQIGKACFKMSDYTNDKQKLDHMKK